MYRFAQLLAAATLAAMGTVATAQDRVLVIPFNSLNVPSDKQWIGKAAQEDLIADLGRSGDLSPVAFGGQVIVEDNTTAARLGRDAKAGYVVRGAAQVVGENVRLTAQLIDSSSGDTIRTALVTGSASDLLKLEDDLANQIRGTATATATPATPQYVAVPGQVPPVIVITQPEPSYPDYYYPGYYSSYPAYYWTFDPLCNPFSVGGVTFYRVNFGHDHDHDHDVDNHGREGGGFGSGGGAGGRGIQITQQNFNPAGLPIPTAAGNMLPIPTGNIMPIPTGSVLPVPINSGQPIPISGTVPVVSHVNAPAPRIAPASSPPAPHGGRMGGRSRQEN